MLHHVTDVKERRVAACEVVGGADGEGGVLDGHVETAEMDHFRAMGHVEVVERGFAEIVGCTGG